MTVHRYFAPESEAELASLIGRHDDVVLVAGGTDRVVSTRRGQKPLAGTLISLDRVSGLRGLSVGDDGSLVVGALTTHADIEASPTVVDSWTALADGSALIGSPATRNTGTVAGNIMNASPAMDLGSPLLVHGAEVELRSSGGRRQVPFGELVVGPGKTTAQASEYAAAVHVPAPVPGTGSAYVRLQYRRAMEIAVVGAAALIVLDDGIVSEARVALTAVGPTCLDVREATDVLVGQALSADRLDAAAAAAGDVARPISDARADAEYRQALVGTIARRAITFAAERARGRAVPVPASEVKPITNGGGA